MGRHPRCEEHPEEVMPNAILLPTETEGRRWPQWKEACFNGFALASPEYTVGGSLYKQAVVRTR